MMCAWKELLAVLPQWMRQEVDSQGREELQELRLRMGAPPELVLGKRQVYLKRNVTEADLQMCVNAASRYSPWASETTAEGYLTVTGGHRIGLCGEAVVHNGVVTGIRKIHSLCIRVARDFPGIGRGAAMGSSMLILGAPGWGKTTLLRDVARNIAETDTVAVVDQRGELFPMGFQRGKRMDVLSLCPKPEGIDRCLRTMGPQWITVDEITAEEDCKALIQAVGCGVRLLATAHASSMTDFRKRPLYRSLLEAEVFTHCLILNGDRQWHRERMNL